MGDRDVVIIGSGIGGLCCAALLAHYGLSVIVCESHSIPGGAAHAFQRNGYRFDSGPSLYSGMSYRPSANPLKQVLDLIGEELPCATYNTWACRLPEGDFDTAVGAEQFCNVLRDLRGEAAVTEWRNLQRVMEPYAKAAVALPTIALRWDWGAALTVGQFMPSLLQSAPQIVRLTGPFSRIMDEAIGDPFIRNWLDMLCFLLSGLPAHSTSAAEVAFMFADWYRPGVTLDYPIGGSGALVDALVRGLQKQGGELQFNAHVDKVLVEQGRAAGVILRNGKTIRAKRAVVANVSMWDLTRLLPPESVPDRFRQGRQNTPQCDSFMHLHLGIDAEGLPNDLACHAIAVNDWQAGITAPQNVVLVSIPSLLDPNLAPPGQHSLHVYTPGNEPYALWQGMDRSSPDYARQKQERAQIMWQALERIIPDVRSRVRFEQVGTPLTHERYLQRDRGTYGPAIRAGSGLFPGPTTPLPGLLCCGDSTFPGIGLPAVAVSGAIAAHTLVPVQQHLKRLKDFL